MPLAYLWGIQVEYTELYLPSHRYESRAARYLYDLSREVQAAARTVQAEVRESEAQHGKVMGIFEQWNDVLQSAKEKFNCDHLPVPMCYIPLGCPIDMLGASTIDMLGRGE